MARTSARQVAERLGVDPTAAAALRVLRERGLVALEREKGPAGRFGLSVYELGPVAGPTVVRPCTAEPLVVSPPMVAVWQNQERCAVVGSASRETPALAAPDTARPRTDPPDMEDRTWRVGRRSRHGSTPLAGSARLGAC